MIAVFVGPTISIDDCRSILPDAKYLPPVSQGDVYRAALRQPSAIGIIDGYFEQVPSVWHKEILWALSQSIYVFGSASMGALRAAELYTFGMEGVGGIFAAYRDGIFEDDDEVAVAHAPAELGYLPLSEPMVNIRATLDDAAMAGLVSVGTRDMLIAAAKALYFPERDYTRILADGLARGASRSEIELLQAWLPNNRRDAKRQDAIAMLEAISLAQSGESVRPRPSFVFEATALWLEFIRSANHVGQQKPLENPALRIEEFISKFKAGGHWSPQLKEALIARVLALDESRRHGFEAGDGAIQESILRFRRQHGLEQSQDLERWMEKNDIELPQFLKLVESEARLVWTRSLMESELETALIDYLRIQDQYPHFKQIL